MNPIVPEFGAKVRWLLTSMKSEVRHLLKSFPEELPETQAHLARELHISISRLSNWMSSSVDGTTNPDPKIVETILSMYGIGSDGLRQGDPSLVTLIERCRNTWRSTDRTGYNETYEDSLEDFVDAYVTAAKNSALIFSASPNNGFRSRESTKQSPLVRARGRELFSIMEQLYFDPLEQNFELKESIKNYVSNKNNFDRPNTNSILKFELDILQKVNSRAAFLCLYFLFLDRNKIDSLSLINEFCSPDYPTLVLVPEGRFSMGASSENKMSFPNENPVHTVTIDYKLAVSQTQITFRQYDKFVHENGLPEPLDNGYGRGEKPVINVSWHEAVQYTIWLSSKSGGQYRLLSESEWEYCCRSGSETDFCWGKEAKMEYANHNGHIGMTTEIRSYDPNNWGLYDMHGNVWEWVQDSWHDSYHGAPVDGGAWEDNCDPRRVMRGGSWQDGPIDIRCSNRSRIKPEGRNSDIGFRVARLL